MVKLISISGAMASGKTTVARMLATKLSTSFAYVDGDMLAAGISAESSKPIDERLPAIHAQLIRFIRANARYGNDMIVDYPINDDVRASIIDALEGVDVEYFWFILKPNMAKVLAGSEGRVITNEEAGRIQHHYESSLLMSEMATVIDSTNQTAEGTVEEILGYLG